MSGGRRFCISWRWHLGYWADHHQPVALCKESAKCRGQCGPANDTGQGPPCPSSTLPAHARTGGKPHHTRNYPLPAWRGGPAGKPAVLPRVLRRPWAGQGDLPRDATRYARWPI